ncbi:unnamed protein product [Onchocerca flexuosa]|uniref:Uncharacterized protein n=1 Tax=Onchocerca flexuosa TaxID=387005 RepID=A0A183HGN5_9BILA|nr:unnamed protein product [Onchocerca flexuosa]
MEFKKENEISVVELSNCYANTSVPIMVIPYQLIFMRLNLKAHLVHRKL